MVYNFSKRLKNFSQIDFQNVNSLLTYSSELKQDVQTLLVDNKLKVVFIHHIYDKSAHTPIKCGPNLFYENISNYLIEQWKKRVIKKKKNNLHFICIANELWNDNDINQFIQLKTPFKKSLIVYNKKFLSVQKKHFKVTYVGSSKEISTYRIAQIFLDDCKRSNYLV